MPEYRKLPIVVNAVQYVDDNLPEPMLSFLEGTAWRQDDDGIALATNEGEMKASKGDYIIRGIAGEVYPCKPGIFEATYEPA